MTRSTKRVSAIKRRQTLTWYIAYLAHMKSSYECRIKNKESIINNCAKETVISINFQDHNWKVSSPSPRSVEARNAREHLI